MRPREQGTDHLEGPPVADPLPDREQARAAVADIRQTYQRDGLGPAMAKFLMLSSTHGEIPADFADLPVNPADFGLPSEDDGSRDDPLIGQNLVTCTYCELDYDALRTSSARIVVGVGAESDGERPLTASLYYNRLAQRVSAALSVPTAAGALYEVDTRLRPLGAQGPLAVSFDSFERYQREDAWTWEHMALTRARVPAWDCSTCATWSSTTTRPSTTSDACWPRNPTWNRSRRARAACSR